MRNINKAMDYTYQYIKGIKDTNESVTEWCFEHKVNFNEAAETIADYMCEHDVNDPTEIDAETFEDMLGAE